MTYAILSDIHANESAFRRVLRDAKAHGADRIVCLGDVVGYGPLPEETANLVRATCRTVLAGNHDDAVTGRADARDFIDLAADAVVRHRQALSAKNLDWLGSLPHACRTGGFVAAHGDFTDPKSFNYIQDEASAAANFAVLDAPLAFVGHTHTPEIFLTGASGKVYRIEPGDFVLEDGKRYIVNPGSVGYPRERDGVCRSSYVLYDAVTKTVRFRFLPFDVSSVLQRGRPAGRPVRKRIVAALLVVLAVLVGGTACWLMQGKADNTVRVEAPLVLKEDIVKLTPELRQFLPNLKLSHGSAPLDLQVEFRSDDSTLLDKVTVRVKQSRSKAIPVPAGATSAKIALLKLNAADSPRIRDYRPAFKP